VCRQPNVEGCRRARLRERGGLRGEESDLALSGMTLVLMSITAATYAVINASKSTFRPTADSFAAPRPLAPARTSLSVGDAPDEHRAVRAAARRHDELVVRGEPHRRHVTVTRTRKSATVPARAACGGEWARAPGVAGEGFAGRARRGGREGKQPHQVESVAHRLQRTSHVGVRH